MNLLLMIALLEELSGLPTKELLFYKTELQELLDKTQKRLDDACHEVTTEMPPVSDVSKHLFIVYAPKDKSYAREFSTRLFIFGQTYGVKIRLMPLQHQYLTPEQLAEIEKCYKPFVCLLETPNSCASYLYSQAKLLMRISAKLIPIYVRQVPHHLTGIPGLPPNGKCIANSNNQDELWVEVVTDIINLYKNDKGIN